MKNLISARELEFSYLLQETPVLILNGINVDIEEGGFICIVGHNGSGKSTFAKSCNAILRPTAGKLYVSDMDTADEDRIIDIRKTVGMVFQNPDNQIVANVVEEDVAFAPENLGIPTEEIRKRVDDALLAVGMEQYKTHAPHMLSGGQKQRVAIAGVIAMQPKCIVLDEPTAMIDPAGRKEVLSAIKKLNKEYGVTIILITHHMNEAAEADRLIVMNDGEIFLDGPPREIFMRVDDMKSVGLTVPDTVELLYELRKIGFDIPLGALDVDECAKAIHDVLTE